MSTKTRYSSDMTDAEWTLLAPMLPTPACQTKAGGRPEKHDRRDIVDAIRYIVDNGCKWRALPHDYGVPWQTVYSFFARWSAAGVVEEIRDRLRRRIRVRSKRCPNAVEVIIDSQSVKASETVSAGSRGYDPGKRINGRKRHLVVDGGGLPIIVMVTPADVFDRDAARVLLTRLHDQHPEVTRAWADGAYSGELIGWVRKTLGITLTVVKRPKDAKGFVVLPKRWVVERTNSWVLRARRLVRDHERLISHSEAHLNWSAITLMTRRLTRNPAHRSKEPWR
jgi:transposase